MATLYVRNTKNDKKIYIPVYIYLSNALKAANGAPLSSISF